MTHLAILAIDHGAGNIKVYGDAGGIILPSQVSLSTGDELTRIAGLHTTRPPLKINVDGHEFYVGNGAHDWGRPIENLDDSRFITGSPETIALTYAAITTYTDNCFDTHLDQDVEFIVGLPQSALTGDVSVETSRGVRSWLRKEHNWNADGSPCEFKANDVTITSQAAGALFDFFLDESGEFITDRKPEFRNEIAVLSIGMNTLEMLVTERGIIKQRFTDSQTLGVRRLLELCDPQGLYSRGELDSALRSGALDYRDSLPVWAAEISGRLEQRWGRALRRFRRVILVGGGAMLINGELTRRFAGRDHVPDDPILSVARGLYKIARMRAK